MLSNIFTAAIAAVAATLSGQAIASPAPGRAALVARQGYTADCTSTYSVQSGDRCIDIRDKFNATFTLDDFYSWNPQVDQYCSNLYPGEVVCVGVNGTSSPLPSCPAPVKPGIVSNCDACYTVVQYDYCYAVAVDHGITLDQLLAWNPDLNSDCTNLEEGYNYCVGVSE
ncbi:hypothetical protein F5X96DRAFT_516890 [Biscogniauxia mediterranea]|nr:hypothetical protein F5X96DRAFT_516890 [Biscogniauxia mediterranea]